MEEKKPIILATILMLLWVWITPVIEEPIKSLPIPIIKARTTATTEEKKANKQMAKDFAWAGYGWRNSQFDCANNIFMAESRYDHLAKNRQGSTAYGIGQLLSETSSDPAIQILRAYNYIKYRYNTPCRAWRYHKRTGHY